jgi:hypothetical protein
MLKKFLAMTLACSLFSVVVARPTYGGTKKGEDASSAEKLKRGLSSLGTGESVRVKVRLRDKTKLRGYVSQVEEDGFVVTDPDAGVSRRVAFADVAQIKGKNLSTDAQLVIAAGIVTTILVLAVIVALEAN